MTLAAPTLYTDTSNALNNRTLTWGAFTSSIGDLLIVKVATEDAGSSIRVLAPSASSGGVTFTKQVENIVSSHTYGAIYTGSVTTAPTGGQITVTSAPAGAGSTLHAGVLCQYVNAKIAATPATANTNGTGAPSSTITTTANGSIVESLNGDWAAVDGSSRAYLSSGVEQGYVRDASGARASLYFWRQAAATAGSQTIGLSAPTGQTYSMLAIEIQDNPGASVLPRSPIVVNQAALIRASLF